MQNWIYIFLYTLERDVKFSSSRYTLHIVKIYEGKLSKDFDERNFYAENFHIKLLILLIKFFKRFIYLFSSHLKIYSPVMFMIFYGYQRTFSFFFTHSKF